MSLTDIIMAEAIDWRGKPATPSSTDPREAQAEFDRESQS